MNPNKALWEKGDFTRIAQSMRESGEALVRSLGITRGSGSSTSDAARNDRDPQAKLGADVLGVDIAANLVEAGNRRAEEAGLAHLRFQEGDASNLQNLKDRSFDLVVSIFGAMFAPKPFDVAKEMVRVTKPGGRIAMGNWIPNDPTLVAQILKISSSYSPPPPEGFISPMTWGVEKNVIERFGGAGIPQEKISFARDTYVFNFSGAPVEFVAAFRTFYGPTMNAFDAAEKNGRADDLRKELEALFTSHDKSANGTTSIPATFLRGRGCRESTESPAVRRRGCDPIRQGCATRLDRRAISSTASAASPDSRGGCLWTRGRARRGRTSGMERSSSGAFESGARSRAGLGAGPELDGALRASMPKRRNT
jgi:SAM-dependent methyltransferase